MKKIMQLCNISEYRYNELVFNQGIEYLKHETSNDEFYVSEIAQTKMFWEWWNSVIEERAVLFLSDFGYSTLSSIELYYIWESFLSIGSLEIYPPAKIWSAGYEDVIQSIIKTSII